MKTFDSRFKGKKNKGMKVSDPIRNRKEYRVNIKRKGYHTITVGKIGKQNLIWVDK